MEKGTGIGWKEDPGVKMFRIAGCLNYSSSRKENVYLWYCLSFPLMKLYVLDQILFFELETSNSRKEGNYILRFPTVFAFSCLVLLGFRGEGHIHSQQCF